MRDGRMPPALNKAILFTIQKNPCDYKGHTLRILCTELNAVPHAGLGFQILRVSVGNQQNLGVFKRRGGPKRKEPNDEPTR